MTVEQYQELIKELTEHRNNISNQKRKDYCKGSKDIFNNFKSVAENTGLNPLQVLLVYANKHWDAICNYIKTNGQSESEPIKDRISDLLVYLELLWGLINDLGIGMKGCDVNMEFIDSFSDGTGIALPERPLPPIEAYENYYDGVCEDKQQLYIEKITIDGSLEKYQTCGVFDKEKFAKEIDDFMEQYYKIRPFNTGKEKLDLNEKETGKSFGI